MSSRQAQTRPDLTAAVLLWAWDRIMADMALGDVDHRAEGPLKAAKSELLRLGLIDDMGIPTKEGRRVLGLI